MCGKDAVRSHAVGLILVVLAVLGCSGGDWFAREATGTDLTCQYVEILTPEVTSGGRVSLRFVVVNDGSTATPGFCSVVRLACGERYSVFDPVLGQFWTDVDGNTKRDRTQTCTVPTGTPPGVYRISVKLDVRGEVDETDETNNVFVSASTLTVRPLVVDIVAEEVEPGAGVLYTGEENPQAVSAALANLGADSVGPFDYVVTLEPGGVRAAEGTVDGLQSAAGVELTLSVQPDASAAEGAYHLVLSADPLDAIRETDESNNVISSQEDVTVRPRLTDVFAVVIESMQAELPHGGELVLTLVCACEGTDPAPPFDCLLKLRKEPSGQEIVLGYYAFAGLEPGAQEEVVLSFDLPWDSPSGKYDLIAVVDPDDALPETDEGNNVLVSPTPVKLGEACFDIAVVCVSASVHQIDEDEDLTVAVVFGNPAADRSPGFDCSLHLSADECLSDDDALLGRWSLERLEAGESRQEVFCVLPPQGLLSDPFYVIACADPDDALAETDESNNVGFDPEVIKPVGKKWAVITGIAQYPAVDPPFADQDAKDLYAKLLESDEYDASRMTLLIDSQATKFAIRSAVQTFGAEMGPCDTLVFFFSGEASRRADVPPYDESDGHDEYIRTYYGNAYSLLGQILDDELADWFTEYVPPGAGVCVIIQGSRAGGMRNDFESLNDLVALLGCAEVEECSSDYTLQSYGVFAYYMLEAFNTKEADANGDGTLSAEEIGKYAGLRTIQYLQGSGVSEHPEIVDRCDGELGVRKAP